MAKGKEVEGREASKLLLLVRDVCIIHRALLHLFFILQPKNINTKRLHKLQNLSELSLISITHTHNYILLHYYTIISNYLLNSIYS